MRFWVLDLIIVERNVRVSMMIVGTFLKSVKRKRMRNVTALVYKELEMSLKN
ncbi:hypothetical protein bcere0007_52130 [Bacillus mycoides]|nr:hypothetical protein bcere0007_52130 [Bacillus mycoides]